RPTLPHGKRDLALVQIEQLTPALRDDRQLARKGLVHEHAEGVDVRLRDDVGSNALLRRHVFGRAERVARLRERFGGRELAHAEIENLRRAIGTEKDVPRLEVAMNHALLVCTGEGAANADEDG